MLRLCLSALLTGTVPLAAPLPAAARPVGEAQDRCMSYGFTFGNGLARCSEIELNYPDPKHWKIGDLDRASRHCLPLGYRGPALADCKQRFLRDLPPPAATLPNGSGY